MLCLKSIGATLPVSGLQLLMLLFSLGPIWTPRDRYIYHNCGLLLLVSHNYVCAQMFQIIPATCLCLSLYAVQACILHHTATYWIVSRAPLHRCNLVPAGTWDIQVLLAVLYVCYFAFWYTQPLQSRSPSFSLQPVSHTYPVQMICQCHCYRYWWDGWLKLSLAHSWHIA